MMKALDSERLNRLIAAIHQQVFLFNDTIENNITLEEDFPAERMERALRISGVADFAARHEDGLAHPAGERAACFQGPAPAHRYRPPCDAGASAPL